MNRLVAAYGLYYLDNRPIVVRGATLPYIAVAPAARVARLAAVRDVGFTTLVCDVPWAVHQPDRDQFDFSGQTDPHRDLVGFLSGVRQMGLTAVLRPGPSLPVPEGGGNDGCYPAWLPNAIPEALALDAEGRPAWQGTTPVFSLLHPAYLAAVERWYNAVTDAVRPFAGDTVVAWQLDSQTGHAFANAIGRLDFNPDTVARYRAYLQETYGDVGALQREWHRPVARLGDVQPPTARSNVGELQDWQAFLEHWVARYLSHLRDVVRQLGMTVPLAVDESIRYASPENPRAKAPIADFYGYRTTVQHGAGPLGVSQAASRFRQFATSERPSTCWGLGVGDCTPGDRDTAATVRALVASLGHGVKAYVVDVGVNSAAGGRSGDAVEQDLRQTFARFHEFVAAHEEELTASVEVQDAIAYLDYQPYTRFAPDEAKSHRRVGSAPPQPAQAPHDVLLAPHALLLACGYNAPFVDLQATTDEALAEYPVAVFPCRGYLNLDDYGKLVVFTLRGGALVTFPVPATRQRDGTPFRSTFLWPDPELHQARRRRPVVARLQWTWRRLLPGAVATGQPVGDDVPAAYRVQVRDGTSTVIPTVPGAAYGTPAYHKLTARGRLALRRFVVSLFGTEVSRQIAPDDDLEIEVVARLSPDGGCLLFAINHLGPQAGIVRFPQPAALNLTEPLEVEVLFSLLDSHVEPLVAGLRLHLAAGEALVLRVR